MWIKVPSHVTIEGNNEPEWLAEAIGHTHPLNPFTHTLCGAKKSVPCAHHLLFEEIHRVTQLYECGTAN